nr:MAG TPA: hypothetical protein [Caudoviricetes sp.]
MTFCTFTAANERSHCGQSCTGVGQGRRALLQGWRGPWSSVRNE